VGREVYSQTGERIMLKTMVPVQYEFTSSKREINLVLKYTRLGAAREQYNYVGSVLEYMTLKEVETPEGYDLHITLRTKKDSNFNTLLTNDGILNIVASAEGVVWEAPKPESAIVLLDAGHGGAEVGTTRQGIYEKTLNLAITQKVGQILTANGIRVEYTRQADTTVALEERARIANALNATIFVSIHCNSVTQTTVSGTETFFYAPIASPALFEQRTERLRLAEAIQSELLKTISRTDRKVKESNLSVLRNTKMPSALVEVAFMSNEEEMALLLNDAFQQRAAEGIANGIMKYLNTSGQAIVINPVF
jgi:N-acetylmuramoyl-L-alanine amidase